MNKKKRLPLSIKVIIGIFVFLIVFNLVSYSTKENEYTVVKQFGKIQTVNTEPGLNWNVPFIQNITSIPKNKQFYDLPKSEVITSDKKTMIVDAYVLWNVTDPTLFTQSLGASTSAGEGRIDVTVYNAIKTTISSMTQEELIVSRDNSITVSNEDAALDDVDIKDIEASTETGSNSSTDAPVASDEKPEVIAISQRLLDSIGNQCDDYGIEITDVRIKVLDLPDENKEAVYQRMITERNNIAAAYTAQGDSAAQVIKNTTDKEVSVMLSEAQATADSTVAQGEAEYMKILSNAYNDADKADFYLYSLSLDTAKASLKNGNTTLFLDKDSPIAQIFSKVN